MVPGWCIKPPYDDQGLLTLLVPRSSKKQAPIKLSRNSRVLIRYPSLLCFDFWTENVETWPASNHKTAIFRSQELCCNTICCSISICIKMRYCLLLTFSYQLLIELYSDKQSVFVAKIHLDILLFTISNLHNNSSIDWIWVVLCTHSFEYQEQYAGPPPIDTDH